MKTTSWLWPDHPIGKRESRRLREEHNKLVNSHAELLAALERALAIDAPNVKWTRAETIRSRNAWREQARSAIAAARGE
jgi:hypothetical protein